MRVERGRLSAVFDENFAFLREIAIDGEELFRGIGFVVRDAQWGTPALSAAGAVEERDDGLIVEAGGRLEQASGDLDWRIRWEISADAVAVEAHWSSAAGFLTNRTGFVVLHSLGAARGQRAQVVHPDAAEEVLQFPLLVSPHQPFFDIAGMRYGSARGARVDLSFEGEVFETEDQRNWTDASYKTYCRPLRLGFPYRIEAGAANRQGLRLRLQPAPRAARTAAASEPVLGPLVAAPRFGVSLGPEPPTPGDAAALTTLGLDFTALELDPADPQLSATLKAALAMATGPVRLDFRPAPRDARLDAVREAVASLGARPCLGFTLWGADDDEIDAVHALAPHQRLGAGSATFFAELNRMRLPARADYLAFAATPTVHGDSDDTLGETTETWEDLMASYEALSAGRELHLGPLSLRMRFNPNATTEEGRRPSAPDPRQSHPIAAAWMLATITGALGTARAISAFQPCGPRGLVSQDGALTPAAQTMLWLRAARGRRLRKVTWPQSPRARGLLCEDGTLLVSHASAGDATVLLPPGAWSVQESVSDSTPVLKGGSLTLKGFAVSRLIARSQTG